MAVYIQRLANKGGAATMNAQGISISPPFASSSLCLPQSKRLSEVSPSLPRCGPEVLCWRRCIADVSLRSFSSSSEVFHCLPLQRRMRICSDSGCTRACANNNTGDASLQLPRLSEDRTPARKIRRGHTPSLKRGCRAVSPTSVPEPRFVCCHLAWPSFASSSPSCFSKPTPPFNERRKPPLFGLFSSPPTSCSISMLSKKKTRTEERCGWLRPPSCLLSCACPSTSAAGHQIRHVFGSRSALPFTLSEDKTRHSGLSSTNSPPLQPLHSALPRSSSFVSTLSTRITSPMSSRFRRPCPSADCKALFRSPLGSFALPYGVSFSPRASCASSSSSSSLATRLVAGGGVTESRRTYYDSRWVRRLDRLREPRFYQPGPPIQEEEVFDEGRIHPLLKPVSPNWNSRRVGVLAYKVGMLSLWDGWGARHPVTVCQLDRCMVMEQRTLDKDGYEACVMGIGYKPLDKVTKPMLGVYIRTRIEPKSRMAEFKCSSDCLLPIGHEMSVRHFTPGQYVFVSGWSKDKGFLGVKKRWGFAGQNASHGVEAKAHSSPGSIGQSKTVNVVWRFKKMAGHAGGDPRVVNCKVFRIEAQRNLIFLKGCVPGYKGSLVKISDARGKSHHKYNRNVPLHFPTFVPQPNIKYPVTIQCPDTEQDPFVYPEIAIPDKEG